MELTLTIGLSLGAAAVACEFIDSSLGMLYGTILSPVLIICGFDPLVVVPAILFSQAAGGITASILHQRLNNSDFSLNMDGAAANGVGAAFSAGATQDLKVVSIITVFGVFASVFAAAIAVSVPKPLLKTYIGLIVAAMGALIISGRTFKFSWKKMFGIGLLSAFNKGISGGGFGPVVTAGQVVCGRDAKNSIGATTLSEAPICLAAFAAYSLSGKISWELVLILTAGSVAGALAGPFFTAGFQSRDKLKLVLGYLTLGLGLFILLNTWLLNLKGVSA
jgi:hypothetical protein